MRCICESASEGQAAPGQEQGKHGRYDRPVDVLHIVLGEALPYEGEGRPLGIELDYALDTDTPSGAKVIGFKKYGWLRRVDKLAEIIADHLAINRRTLAAAIRHRTKDL
jgi:hypothetical protein